MITDSIAWTMPPEPAGLVDGHGVLELRHELGGQLGDEVDGAGMQRRRRVVPEFAEGRARAGATKARAGAASSAATSHLILLPISF